MPVYYELVNDTIYVCNRNGNVKQPLGDINNIGLSLKQKQCMVYTLNSTYRAAYDTAINRVRALIDQLSVEDNRAIKKTTN